MKDIPIKERAFRSYEAAINAAVESARETGEISEKRINDGAVAYAYPHQRGVAWGVNGAHTGRCILRGVRLPNGEDEGS